MKREPRIDCDRMWTRLVTWTYRLRGLPRVTQDPPPVVRKAPRS